MVVLGSSHVEERALTHDGLAALAGACEQRVGRALMVGFGGCRPRPRGSRMAARRQSAEKAAHRGRLDTTSEGHLGQVFAEKMMAMVRVSFCGMERARRENVVMRGARWCRE